MEEFVKGDVVVLPFPFSDLSNISQKKINSRKYTNFW